MRYIRIDAENDYFADSVYVAVSSACSDMDLEVVAEEAAYDLADNYSDVIDQLFHEQIHDWQGLSDDLWLLLEKNYNDSITFRWEEIEVEEFRMNAEDQVYGA